MFYLFGSSPEQLDAFIAAFRIPNALRELLAEGALAATFVPILSSLLANKQHEKAHQFASVLLIFSLAVTFFIVILVYCLPISWLEWYHYNPSFEDSSLMFGSLLSILIFYLPIISLSALVMSMLNATNSFLIPASGPIVSNIIFFIILFLFESVYGIATLAYAMIGAGLGQLLIQLPYLRKTSFQWNLNYQDIAPQFRQWKQTFIPLCIALGLPKLNFILSNLYAGQFIGANTVLAQSFFIVQLPISTFVVGISIVSLTKMSHLYALNHKEELHQLIITSVKMVLLFAIPCTFGIFILAENIAYMLYQDLILLFSQLFSSHLERSINVNLLEQIAYTLLYACPSVISVGLSIILVRIFQTFRYISILSLSSLAHLLMHLLLMFLFIEVWNYSFVSIALSLTLCSFSHILSLSFFMERRISLRIFCYIWVSLFKFLASSILMALFIYVFQSILDTFSLSSFDYIDRIVKTIFLILSGALIYFLSLFIMKERQAQSFILSIVSRHKASSK